jgi:hypothetical protein
VWSYKYKQKQKLFQNFVNFKISVAEPEPVEPQHFAGAGAKVRTEIFGRAPAPGS